MSPLPSPECAQVKILSQLKRWISTLRCTHKARGTVLGALDFLQNLICKGRTMFDTYVESGTVLHNYAHVCGPCLCVFEML